MSTDGVADALGYSLAELDDLVERSEELHPGARFASAEEAALASWGRCPSAQARVVSATVSDRTALVVIDTVPSHPDEVQCLRLADGWIVTASSG